MTNFQKTFNHLLFAFLIGVTLSLPNNANLASAGGQQDVKLNQNGDTIYLSTQIDNGSQSNTIKQIPLLNYQVSLPKGFAQDLGHFLNATLSLVMMVSALLVFFYLIWAGIQWITSGGDKSKTEAARNKITAAVIGLIVVSASYAILTLILRFLGFNDINDALNNLQPLS